MEVTIGPISAIPPGEGRAVQAGPLRIAVFHARDGCVYAVQADCPHRGGPLADGLVGGATVVCPLHSRKFDLTSGQALVGECDLKTYPARLDESGRIVLTVSAATPPA